MTGAVGSLFPAVFFTMLSWNGFQEAPLKPVYFAILLSFALASSRISMGQVCKNPMPSSATGRGLEIPVAIHGGGVFVPVVMNDGKTYNFLLDSGFEDSVLDPSTVASLHLREAGRHTESAPGGQVETSIVGGVKRSVGGVALTSKSLSSLDLSDFAPLFGRHLDGVLGFDFFQQFVVVLDYEHRQLTLCDPESFRPGQEHAVALNLKSHQPYMDVEIEATNGKLVDASIEVDTGKVDSFSLNAAFARAKGLVGDTSKLLALKGISVGGETQAWVTRATSVRFDSVLLKNPVMGVAEENSERAGQLGYGTLRRFKITFDYSRAQIFFRPNASLNEPFEFDHAGLLLGAGGPKLSSLMAFMVIAGTPASDAGIQQGDEIVTIEGRSASTFTLDEARHFFENAVGAQKLTLRRRGSTFAVTVVCRQMV